ncbi:MAG TPA: peptidoglycan DD-metalloendopeptidase family protein [Candidatus Binatia bacterium]|nr:peptidoglycan DD-metalloendopeptidase family protein [Candidatus Binatia bacterium]
MGLEIKHTGTRGMSSGRGKLSGFPSVFRTLVWLWVISFALAVKPTTAQASKQKDLRKEVSKGKTTAPTAPIRKLTKSGSEPSADLLERREHVAKRTKAGDSLLELLSRFRLSNGEKQLWTRSIQRHVGHRGLLPANKEVHFYFTKVTPGSRQGPRLKAIEVDFSDTSTLTWEKGIRGVLFQKREKPYDIELKTISASVENSLFTDGQQAGIHPTLLSQLADIFTWDVDFEKDIRKGDSIKILYEQRSRKGLKTKASLRILAAELISAGQKLTAIYFEKKNGEGKYYNLEGRSLARSFLRFPLEFINITSHFSDSRFHPILKVNLPHTGVDFAAKRGTPVRSVGDGVITMANWNGVYGKTVEIQHDSTYTTRYAHLEKFAQGIRNGTAVVKGQIIGYVGSTGRATGPHLHFELYKDQQYIDPLSVDFPAEDLIEPRLQTVFDNQKYIFLVELSSAPQS